MVYAIFTFIALGIAGGYFFLGLEHKDLLDEILMSALYFMVFVAGIEIGGNRHMIKKSAIRRVFCWQLPFQRL